MLTDHLGLTPTPTPGAAGVGDPYFPLDGNGGYDVAATTSPSATTRPPMCCRARRTSWLRRRRPVVVQPGPRRADGALGRGQPAPATFQRNGDELTVVPRVRCATVPLQVVVRYEGVPETVEDPVLGGISGFVHTDDGALVAGSPTLQRRGTRSTITRATRPRTGSTSPCRRARGRRQRRATSTRTRSGWTTWTWEAREPMASYLDDGNDRRVRHQRLQSRRHPVLGRPRPRHLRAAAHAAHREQVADLATAELSYKRLTRTITVPAGGRP